ncbi:MAG: hypothetical protein ACTHKH_09265 [Trinickia sp.]
MIELNAGRAARHFRARRHSAGAMRPAMIESGAAGRSVPEIVRAKDSTGAMMIFHCSPAKRNL